MEPLSWSEVESQHVNDHDGTLRARKSRAKRANVHWETETGSSIAS